MTASHCLPILSDRFDDRNACKARTAPVPRVRYPAGSRQAREFVHAFIAQQLRGRAQGEPSDADLVRMNQPRNEKLSAGSRSTGPAMRTSYGRIQA